MQTKRITLFLLSLVVVLQARATTSSLGLSARDELIYGETLAVCKQSSSVIRSVLNQNTLDSFLVSTGQSLSLLFGNSHSPEALQKEARQNLLSDYTFDRLQSDGFIQAVQTCFPNNPTLQQSFVLSMMAADTLGKVPSIVSMIYLTKVTGSLWLKVGALYPKVLLSLKVATPLVATLYTVLDVRKNLANRELTDFEKQRLKQIADGVREGTDSTKTLVIEMAQDEIKQLEQDLATSTHEPEREQIRAHIKRIQNSLKDLGQFDTQS